jgi:hypothetical protein
MMTILEDCKACGKSGVRFSSDSELDGQIEKYDLCLDCDDKAHKMMDAREAMATFMRLGGYLTC